MLHYLKIVSNHGRYVFSVNSKLCAFINTTVTYMDDVHIYTNGILACKQQHRTQRHRTQRAHKYTFTCTKKDVCKCLFFEALVILKNLSRKSIKCFL